MLAAIGMLAYDEAEGDERTPTRRTPDVGFKVADGYLVGVDRGEWGGELTFIADGRRNTIRLLTENIHGIHQLGARIVVVAGVAHLTLNRGALYSVTRAPAGGYRVTYWKTLPGAPRKSGFLPDGRLYVSCASGDVVITSDGRMVAPP